jgi:hypothetical protein
MLEFILKIIYHLKATDVPILDSTYPLVEFIILLFLDHWIFQVL